MNNFNETILFLKRKFPELENLNETMHRGEIEQELNNLFIYYILKISRYLNSSDEELFNVYLEKYKINIIKNVFRDLVTNTDYKLYLKNISNWTKDIFKSIDGIDNLNNVDDFLFIIRNEEFANIFKEYDLNTDDIPLDEIEVKLDIYYFKRIYEISKGKNSKVHDLVGTEIDLLNIMWILRAKKYYKYEIPEIDSVLIPINYKLRKKEIISLLKSNNFDEMQAILSKTKYKDIFKSEDTIEFDKDIYLYKINTKIIKTKMFDVSTVFACINLLDYEIKNYINIIEGIRYSIDAVDIRKKIIN